MIRYLDENEKCGSRELWEEAFPEDSRSFDDYYFEEKLKDNRILVLEEAPEADKARIVSMIQLNPYEVRAAGRQWRVDYLVGVATRKDRRHRGYMRRLLNRMMGDMRREGMPFCFLMPAAEAIYRPFGFTYIYRQPQVGLKAGVMLEEREVLDGRGFGEKGQSAVWCGGGPGEAAAELPALPEISSWMNRWLQSRYEVFAVRNEAYVRRLFKELASENGSFRLLYDQDVLVGMLGEWGLDKREQRLLYCGDTYVEEREAPKPAIMARIITPENFVRAVCLEEAYAGETLTIRLRLADPLIPENDGWWLWHLDKKTSWMEPGAGGTAEAGYASATEGKNEAGETELSLTIEEFTFWLFGYGVPEAVRETGLEHVVRGLRGVFLDEVV